MTTTLTTIISGYHGIQSSFIYISDQSLNNISHKMRELKCCNFTCNSSIVRVISFYRVIAMDQKRVQRCKKVASMESTLVLFFSLKLSKVMTLSLKELYLKLI